MIEPIIVGSVALDSVETPSETVENVLGGSAVFASIAASYFKKPGIVGVAGTDFPKEHLDFLREKNVDLEGLKIEGKTFRWSGKYKDGMDQAETKKVELNSFENFSPMLPENYKKSKYVLLGNINPELQVEILDQVYDPVLTALDSMDIWINSKRDCLLEAIKKVNLLLLNEGEAKLLFKTSNLVKAGFEGLDLGIEYFIIKKGENGSLMFSEEGIFSAPAYPLQNLKDPTGCGDCFAGGLIGYLAKKNKVTEKNLRQAMVYGASIASINAEDHGLDGLKKSDYQNVQKRYNELKEMSSF